MGAMDTYQTFRANKPLYTGGMMNRKGLPPHWQFYFIVDDKSKNQRILAVSSEAAFLCSEPAHNAARMREVISFSKSS